MKRSVSLIPLYAVVLVGCTPSPDFDSTELEGPETQTYSPERAQQEYREYNRDLFGDYDREAILENNFRAYPTCDGYYSAADDICHISASDVEIDHIVALSEAWQSGADNWTNIQLEEFGYYSSNLWVMTTELNRSKSDKDLAEWLPPYEAIICDYVVRYEAVKEEWNLSADSAEQNVGEDC